MTLSSEKNRMRCWFESSIVHHSSESDPNDYAHLDHIDRSVGHPKIRPRFGPALLTLILAAALLAATLLGCDAAEQAGVYDPRTYGAVPNDGIDDSPAFAAVVAAAGAAGGGIVAIPRGQWDIGSPVDLSFFSNGVTLQGAGVDVTRLVRLGDQPIVRTLGSRNQRIADLTLDGRDANVAAPLMYVDFFGWQRSEIQRVKGLNYQNGLQLAVYEVVRLDRLELSTISTSGVAIIVGKPAGAAQGANLTISDSFIRGSSVGVLIQDADAVFMRNTDISSDHIDLLIAPTTTSGNHTFANNFFDATRYASVVIAGPGIKATTIFDGNWIASSPNGFMVHAAGSVVDLSLVGGRIFNIAGPAILVDNPVQAFLVNGVQFSACQRAFVRTENTTGAQIDMHGNQFRGCQP